MRAGPHRVRGGRIPATAATVRWEGHPHTEHDAGTWTQRSTKKPHPQQPSVRELAAGLGEDPAAGRPSGAHTIFITLSKIHMYNLVCGQELAPAPLCSEQEETGHQSTTPTTPPPPTALR